MARRAVMSRAASVSRARALPVVLLAALAQFAWAARPQAAAGALATALALGGAAARPIDELNIVVKEHVDESVADVFNKDVRDALKANPHGLLFWEVEENRGTMRRRLNPDTDKQVTHVAQFVVDEMNARSRALGGVTAELSHVLNPCLFMERGGNALYRFRFQIAVVGVEDRLRHVLRSYEATVHEDVAGKLVVMQERMVDSGQYVDGWLGLDGTVHRDHDAADF